MDTYWMSQGIWHAAYTISHQSLYNLKVLASDERISKSLDSTLTKVPEIDEELTKVYNSLHAQDYILWYET